MNSQDLLNSREVSAWLGLSESALAQLRYLKRGPSYIKISSRSVRYERGAVEAWLASRDRISTSEEQDTA